MMLAGLLCAPGLSLPVYGTTRYGRPAAAPAPSPLYYRPARPYPYTDTYADELYYQPMPVVHYPYYPVSSPYNEADMYRTAYPYYYTPYGYYGNEETYNPAEETIHEDPTRVGGARADALPVGQETWFEGDSTPSWRTDYDDVNAAFLQNLIMSQMYDEALDKSSIESDEKQNQNSLHESDEYDEHRVPEYYGDRNTRDFEDEDVRELKALAGKPLYHVPKTSVYAATGSVHTGDPTRRAQPSWYQDSEDSTPKTLRRDEEPQFSDDYQNDEGWINWGSKRSPKISKVETIKRIMTPKPTLFTTTTTPAPATKGRGGQKEEVLLRPATPARHPFPEPVMHLLAANMPNHNKRSPSVYDTIKRLLTMEESFKPVSFSSLQFPTIIT